MKKIILSWLLISCLWACQDAKTIINLTVEGYQQCSPTLNTKEMSHINFDTLTGIGTIEVELKTPSIINLQIKKYESTYVYLEPGKKVHLLYEKDDSSKRKLVFSGDLQVENEILNTHSFYTHLPPFNYKNDLEKYKLSQDSMLKVNQDLLNRSNVSKEFKELESKRLKAKHWATLARIRIADAEQNKLWLKSLIIEDSTMLNLKEYRDAVTSTAKLLSHLKNTKADDNERILNLAETIVNTFNDKAIRAFLIHENLFKIIAVNGVWGNEKLVQIYKENVYDHQLLSDLDVACSKFDFIAPGKPCPPFTFKNEKGEEVSLQSLSGNYIYIDLWATWCGPCKGEIPSLKELEAKFHGKKITFVSISIDRNKDIDVWKQMVKDMELGGIQLHLGEDWAWLKNFMPASMAVPRFLLLDKKGNIINAAMSRPSDKNTEAVLSSLTDI